MSAVICPSCGEKGNLSDQLLGKKLRCQKCGTSFVAGAVPGAIPTPALHPATPTPAPHPAPLAASPVKVAAAGDVIEVDGLDASTWAATAVAVETRVPEPEHHEPPPTIADEPQAVDSSGAPVRQYKVLTQKDRWFQGKFELARLEEALNHYAHQGWVVRAMATPHVTGFSGGPREELVILMER